MERQYHRKQRDLTSLMNGISRALDTNPGTSLDTVVSIGQNSCEEENQKQYEYVGMTSNFKLDVPFPHAIANARARSKVSDDV